MLHASEHMLGQETTNMPISCNRLSKTAYLFMYRVNTVWIKYLSCSSLLCFGSSCEVVLKHVLWLPLSWNKARNHSPKVQIMGHVDSLRTVYRLSLKQTSLKCIYIEDIYIYSAYTMHIQWGQRVLTTNYFALQMYSCCARLPVDIANWIVGITNIKYCS